MNILQIIPSLHMGGAEKFAIDLSNEMVNNKHNVYLCVLDKEHNTSMVDMIDKKVSVIFLKKTKSYSFKTIFEIFKVIKKVRPHIIHTHLRTLVYASLSIIIFKIPTVHTVHNLAEKEINKTFRMLYKILYYYKYVVPVAISEEVSKSIEYTYKQFDSVLIHNGVPQLKVSKLEDKVKKEIESYKKNTKTKVLLTVGRVSKQKNQLMLINVVNSLMRQNVDILLLIIGSLDNEKEYADQCLLQAEHSVVFLGLKYNIGDYMKYSDVFVLTSLYEGLPLVLLEAMSMNKFIISTPAGGVPDVIKSSDNGLVSKDYSEESFKILLESFLANSEKYISTSNIEEYNKSYSMKVCSEKYLLLYSTLMS